MKHLKWLTPVILVIAGLRSLYAEAHCPGNVPSIRPRLIEHSIAIVPVMLDGAGPFDFVLDTAAQVTTIDPELAAALHLKLSGETQVTGAGFSTRASYARLKSLQTGAYRVTGSLLLVHNLGQIQTADPQVRGILGENFLEHFDLLIDYAHNIVCLDDTKQMRAKVKGEHIALLTSLHPELNLPFTEPLIVAVRISGATVRQLSLQLDSAINTPLLFSAGRLHSAAWASTPLRSRGTDGAWHAYNVLPPQDIQVGLNRLRNVSFVAPAAAGEHVPDSELTGSCRRLSFGAHSSATRTVLPSSRRGDPLRLTIPPTGER